MQADELMARSGTKAMGLAALSTSFQRKEDKKAGRMLHKHNKGGRDMKKVSSFVLALFLMMICTSTSYAEIPNIPHISENLELRGGISYGMTKNEVTQFETEKGNTDYKTKDSSDAKVYNYCIDYTTEIAGVNSQYSHLTYYFDEQNNLLGMGYSFGDGDHPVNGNNIYDKMYSTIVQKYGKPMSVGDLISSSIYSQILYDSLYMKAILKMAGVNSPITKVAQWIIAYDDCYLLIDIHIWAFDSSSDPFLNIGYRLFSESELRSLIGNDAAKQQETDQKRNDDL